MEFDTRFKICLLEREDTSNSLQYHSNDYFLKILLFIFLKWIYECVLLNIVKYSKYYIVSAKEYLVCNFHPTAITQASSIEV